MHPLDIPEFLLIRNRPQLSETEHAAVMARMKITDPMRSAFQPRADQHRAEADETDARRRERKRQQSLARIAKMKARKKGDRIWQILMQNCLPSLSSSRYDHIASEVSPEGRAFLEATWERRGNRYYRRPANDMAKKSKPSSVGNDFASRMSKYTTAASLKKLAKANGVWNDKYLSLPNPGLIRMSVGNRLRVLEKKGSVISWV